MATLEKAIAIATLAHKNQVDKTGEPYINHLLRVMKQGRNEIEKICGVLHDIVEDTPWTFEALAQEGFTNEIIEVLQCVTKVSEEEDYNLFIKRIMLNKTAITVKINDLKDNMDITRLRVIEDKDVIRLNKYLTAYHQLIEFQKTLIYN